MGPNRDQRIPVYVAMLRGVNVTGHNSIKMEQLRALCDRLGFQKVETHVQSGNIVFQAKTENPALSSKRISESILDSFGFETPAIVRTSKEMKNMVANNPFLKEKDVDSSKLHVTLLHDAVQKISLKRLKEIVTSQDRFHTASREIYLYCQGTVSIGIGGNKGFGGTNETQFGHEETLRKPPLVVDGYKLVDEGKNPSLG